MAVSKTDINPQTGKQYAVNPATGAWDDNYWAQNESKFNSGSGSSSSGSSSSVIDQAKQLNQFNIDANQPAIQSLQASIPETQAKYDANTTYLKGQVDPLTQRYDNLIASIKGNQATAEKRTGIATSTELGKRGITSDSGLYANTVNDAVNPITQQYTTELKDTGIQENSDLAALQKLISDSTSTGVDATRAIQNAIAQLQAGNSSSAVTQALSLSQQQQNQTIAQQQQTLADKEYALKEQIANTSDPLAQEKLLAEIQNLQAQTAKLQDSGSGGGDVLSELQALLNAQ